jgi:protein-L-isoaspartate(D-aspartate) O-methyltransferase
MNTVFARRQMVEQQVRTWDVFDATVLEVLNDIPRDQFVPDYCTNAAYADDEIPLPHDQCMLRPSIIGKILQSLEIRSSDDVLDIGTGTGYLASCLARIANTVTSVEIFDDLAEQARGNLSKAGVDNVSVACLDATKELPAGQFDVIVVTGSISEPDERMIEALKPGGRLFVVVGESPVKRAMILKRSQDGSVESSELFETDIPPLLNARIPAVFSF